MLNEGERVSFNRWRKPEGGRDGPAREEKTAKEMRRTMADQLGRAFREIRKRKREKEGEQVGVRAAAVMTGALGDDWGGNEGRRKREKGRAGESPNNLPRKLAGSRKSAIHATLLLLVPQRVDVTDGQALGVNGGRAREGKW
jgi:hypothetical protein